MTPAQPLLHQVLPLGGWNKPGQDYLGLRSILLFSRLLRLVAAKHPMEASQFFVVPRLTLLVN